MLTRSGLPALSDPGHDKPAPDRPTLICFSHLRWNFVFQRPQHLMSRFARDMAVIFWEEPIDIGRDEAAHLQSSPAEESPGVRIVVPHLPQGISDDRRNALLKGLLDDMLADCTRPLISWYYTPMMLPFSRHIEAAVTVYDCMDELSKFRFAPERLLDLEQELIDTADLVFTGGASLYEAKRSRHDSVHCFPSSVDRAHFAKARNTLHQPADQSGIREPRLGFYGVIDERFDIDLLSQIADMRPEWSFVMVGPVVKISEEELPRAANIHYLGPKRYEQLPDYLAGWDVALMPFAMNESTEFISPTKTPEYLAGGRPVVTTPVRDVVRTYGHLQGVKVAADAETFVDDCEACLQLFRDPSGDWLAEADLMLSATSWDTTQARMASMIGELLHGKGDTDRPAMLVAAE